MPNHIAPADVDDLVLGTLRNLGPLTFGLIASDLHQYYVMDKMLKKDKKVLTGGRVISFRVMLRQSATAKNIGLFEQDSTSVPDLGSEGQVPWTFSNVSYGYDVKESMVQSAHEIVKTIKLRRADAALAMANLMEEDMFTLASASDTKAPRSFPYWLVENASAGFNGGLPNGYSDVGGIDPTAAGLSRWKNYTDTWTAVSKADIVTKLRRAMRRIKFRPPTSLKAYDKWGKRYDMLCTEEVIEGLDDLGEAQNENIGKDIASYDGKVLVKGVPLTWVDQMDDAESHQKIYLVDNDTIGLKILKGNYLREGKPIPMPNQHDSRAINIDNGWNLVCENRRANAVLYDAS